MTPALRTFALVATSDLVLSTTACSSTSASDDGGADGAAALDGSSDGTVPTPTPTSTTPTPPPSTDGGKDGGGGASGTVAFLGTCTQDSDCQGYTTGGPVFCCNPGAGSGLKCHSGGAAVCTKNCTDNAGCPTSAPTGCDPTGDHNKGVCY